MIQAGDSPGWAALTGDNGPRSYSGGVEEAWLRRSLLPAGMPDDFKVQKEGSGIRFIIIDADRLLNKTVTSRYRLRHANDVDATTTAGLDAARLRAEAFATVEAPGGHAEPVTYYEIDPRRISGYFFLTAVDQQGNETKEYLWTSQLDGAVLDDRIPGDVTHPQITESGEVINETNYSVLFVKAQAPVPLSSFDRTKLVLKDYPTFGAMADGHSERYLGPAGGTIQFLVRYAPAIRRGAQTIGVTNGSPTVTTTLANFNAIAKAGGGDVLEAFGTQATIGSVSADGNTITLTANWTGPTNAAVGVTDYAVIGQVRIYLVAENKAGNNRPDVENSPYVDVVMDGLMSAPNAPTITGAVIGNGVVIECEQLIGSQAVVYYLWRGTGTSVAFTSCKQIDSIKANLNITSAVNAPLQFRDSDFTAIEKDTGQYFTYYVTAANARGQHSVESNALSLSCRAGNGTDLDPGVIGRVTHKNLLYNAFLTGTGASVISTDTTQDDANGTDASNQAGRPYSTSGALVGLGRFIGHTRWHSFVDGTATDLAFFNFQNEVWLPTPGAGDATVFLYQEIDAWDLGLGGARGCKITKNSVYTISFWARHDGVAPDGFMQFFLEGYNDGAFVGYFPRQYRDANSDLDYYTGASAPMSIEGSSLPSDWTRYHAIFRTDSTIGTVKQLRATWAFHDSAAGTVRITRPMVHEGESPSGWTGDMGDPSTSAPVPADPPGDIGDRIARRDADGIFVMLP